MSRADDGDAGTGDGAADADAGTRPLGPAAFTAELRRLDAATLAAFVADLHRARGREATVDGATVTVRGGERGTRTLAVTRRRPHEATVSGAEPADAVVTSRRVDADARGGVPVVDADDLHGMALYAIDRRAYADLCERYFDRPAFVTDGTDGGGRAPTLRGRPRRLAVALSGRGLAAAGLAAVLVVALAAGALVGLPGGVGGPGADAAHAPDADRTAAPTATAGAPQSASPVTDRPRYAAVECPTPPADAHPSALRPATVDAATAAGLDGWVRRSSSNVTEFYGRTDLPTPLNPEVRHLSTYVAPDGRVYRVVIDRWAGVADADRVATVLAPRRHAVLWWGRYTVAVTGYGGDGRLAPDRAVEGARALLAGVTSPGGSQLGRRCADALLVGTDDPENATARHTPA